MNKNHYFFALLCLVSLVSCGDQVGTNRKTVTPTTLGLNAEGSFFPSYLPREPESPLLTTLSERLFLLEPNQSTVYRKVPSMLSDDDGKNNPNIKTRTSLGRPTTLCGEKGSLRSKITDCAEKNPNSSSWNNVSFGMGGEASWTLVSYSALKNEIWMDNRTGHLWSDVQGQSNWCSASGNQLNEGNPAKVDCQIISGSITICNDQEIDGHTNIRWRLPTRNDFLQADLDGLRFVLKLSNSPFWTATLDSSSEDRSKAWVYVQDQGTLSSAGLTDSKSIRCIGSIRP